LSTAQAAAQPRRTRTTGGSYGAAKSRSTPLVCSHQSPRVFLLTRGIWLIFVEIFIISTAAIPIAAVTALEALRDQGRVHAGRRS
jgi:hypothetical protein